MDIYCKHCGEPWDIAELHEVADATGDYEKPRPFDKARELFYAHGCGAFQNHPPSDCIQPPIVSNKTLAGIAELQDALGSDVDGLASLFSDFRAIGELEL